MGVTSGRPGDDNVGARIGSGCHSELVRHSGGRDCKCCRLGALAKGVYGRHFVRVGCAWSQGGCLGVAVCVSGGENKKSPGAGALVPVHFVVSHRTATICRTA